MPCRMFFVAVSCLVFWAKLGSPAIIPSSPPRPASPAPVANFSVQPGHYSYAWDVIEHVEAAAASGGSAAERPVRYMFYCGNQDEFVIRDSIMYRKGFQDADGRWVFGEERLALPHGGPDSHHDPLPPVRIC